MPKTICVDCQLQFQVENNGIYAVECMDKELLIPYKVWISDAWGCPSCDKLVLAGFGAFPVTERHETGFDVYMKNLDASGVVRFY